MNMIEFKVEGFEELEGNFRRISRAVDDRLFKVLTLLEAAEPIRVMAANLVHYGPRPPHIKNNMMAGVVRKSPLFPEDTIVAVGPAAGKSGRQFFYAHFLEFGTSKRRAYPFMRPAFDAMAPESMRIIQTRVWAQITAELRVSGARP